jgi:hypothetical protein
MPETTKYGQTFYEAEANYLFPPGCREGNNIGGECDWCQVYYYGTCPDCEHNVKEHNDRYGCQHEGLDRLIGDAEFLQASGPCGCMRMAKFYKPISSEANREHGIQSRQAVVNRSC